MSNTTFMNMEHTGRVSVRHATMRSRERSINQDWRLDFRARQVFLFGLHHSILPGS